MDWDIRKVDHFNDLHHTVQLFFDLLKRNIVTGYADGHTGNRLVLCRTYRQTLQII